MFESLDFIARLAALVPEARVNLTRCHGVFAPDNRYRGLLEVPAATQMFSMMANMTATSLKTIGEGLTAIARKQ